eukprot:8136575-Heterocapsa_arctica.AAC.1
MRRHAPISAVRRYLGVGALDSRRGGCCGADRECASGDHVNVSAAHGRTPPPGGGLLALFGPAITQE